MRLAAQARVGVGSADGSAAAALELKAQEKRLSFSLSLVRILSPSWTLSLYQRTVLPAASSKATMQVTIKSVIFTPTASSFGAASR
jgi:hypothetical protein